MLIASLISQPLLGLSQVINYGLGFVAIIVSTVFMIIAIKRKEQKKPALAFPLIVFACYILNSFWLFNTDTLGEYMPSEYDSYYVLINAIKNDDVWYTWTPGDAPLTIEADQNGHRLDLNGLSGEQFYQQLAATKIRNFWWPGATTGNVFFDLSIHVETRTGTETISLRSMDEKVATFKSTYTGMKNYIHNIYLFADLAAFVPAEIKAIVLAD